MALVAAMVAFANLWSTDEKIQTEIAAARAKARAVQYVEVESSQVSNERPAIVVVSAPQSQLKDIAPGQYRLIDAQGNVGWLNVPKRRLKKNAKPLSPVPTTVDSPQGTIHLIPVLAQEPPAYSYRWE